MTKSDLRRQRKAARAAGHPYRPVDEPRDDRTDTQVFTDTPRGQRALERWARWNYFADRD